MSTRVTQADREAAMRAVYGSLWGEGGTFGVPVIVPFLQAVEAAAFAREAAEAASKAREAALVEALETIAELCDAEIHARFVRGQSDGAGKRAMQKSRVYPLLQMPRDLALAGLERAAVTKEPDA